ncbi:nuclease NucT [Legionella massiliensis]|uniref:Nuclease NucT n=2 Tax=Legionella massiliensis TaxID=1034943 RepID=A0A078L2A2_9GAMM|nr:nuclease NucT [Legionella massiliensis]CEE15064.1 Cardiolipin synthase [Legionella massiliensis]
MAAPVLSKNKKYMNKQSVLIHRSQSQRLTNVLFAFLAIFLWLLSTAAKAETYPWVWLGKDDIQVSEHAKVEAEFRLHLIANAKETIDIVTFDQRLDQDIGLPLLQALEVAAKRGIQIRFAAAWLSGLLNDMSRSTERYLRGLAACYPNFKYIAVGGQPMWRQGWGVIDGIHQKIFLVDNKISLVSGRGHAGEYLGWLDTAFFYKGALVDQTREAFEQMWQTVGRESVLQFKSGRSLTNSAAAELPRQRALAASPSLKLSKEEKEELAELKTWAEAPASNNHDYQARSIYYNFLEQMRRQADHQDRTPKSFSYEERAEFLQDPYIEAVLMLLPQTKRFQMNILATIMDERVVEAILRERQRGMEMELITNGQEAHSIFPTAPGWFAGIHILDDLLQAGVVGHEVKQMGPDTGIYLHRKLLILDDHVFFGSHNFTKAGTLTTEEYSIEILSQDFADKMRKLSRHSIEVNTVPFDANAVHQERLITPARQWFASFFEVLYLKKSKKN